MGLLRSKVTGIVFAAVLVGVTGSALAVLTAVQPTTGTSGSTGAVLDNGASSSSPSSTSGSNNAVSPTSGSSNSGNPGDSGDATTPTDTAGAGATATAIPSPVATRTPRPTPTAPPPNWTGTLRGRVGTVNDPNGGPTGNFTLTVGGVVYTCIVSTSTQWPSPTVSSFSALRPGMDANVNGQLQSNGTTFAANSVSADN
jgi:hypothetical protein